MLIIGKQLLFFEPSAHRKDLTPSSFILCLFYMFLYFCIVKKTYFHYKIKKEKVENLLVGCWLLVVSCWLLVVGCWLLVVGCWLLAYLLKEGILTGR